MSLETSREPLEGRTPDASVSRVFLERWSPRAFSTKPVEKATLESLFEAARWAPSCYNEQPWHFVYAATEPDLSRFKSLLVEFNQEWNAPVPVLAFLVARKHFRRNDKPNAWAEMDCGAAWMSLALQAHALGLAAHGMAGFDKERAYQELGVPENTHTVLCAIAIGYPGDAADLSEALREKEVRSGRDPVRDFAHEGSFPR